MIQKLRLILSLIILFSYFCLSQIKVYAISNPTQTLISDYYVFNDSIDSGDMLFFCRYTIDYASTPSEPASDTFSFNLYGEDGITLIASRALNFYDENIISMYFTPAQVTSLGLVWGSSYTIKIVGSPTLFSPVIEGVNVCTRVLGAGSYKSGDDIGVTMLSQASILEADWGIDLLTTGGLLNSTGASYFLRAIPGLSSMAPEVFQGTVRGADVSYSTYSGNSTYAQKLEGNITGFVNSTVNDLAEFFDTDPFWGGIILAGGSSLLLGSLILPITGNPVLTFTLGFMVWVIYALAGVPGLLQVVVVMGLILGLLALFLYILPKLR